MEGRKPPEFNLELMADRANVKEVIKGVLHTIFFHRFFTPLYPATHDVLDLTLPYVSEDDIESLVEQRANALVRQLDLLSTPPQAAQRSNRGQLVVQFLEKKRRKGWFVAKADEETVWENWVIDFVLTPARNEADAARNRQLMEASLQKAAMTIVSVVNKERKHIPPITTADTNPFPYQILVNPKSDGWGHKMGIF
ncbi:Hypothetical protein R9X50_00366300 [Acrodontium crateriforme]|uniref:Autophagy-related protein 101 n=1 Tax=Acrodontium crateriforme TaxID=150365 RepID=A0AAQ3M654_9PEZI|nr:Hypothetical protein R9X50_00366300 [Acrodontium crateriforme]